MGFKPHRAEVAELRMAALRVVEALNVIKDVAARGVSSALDLAGGALGIQRREEALHRGIVADIAGAAHRAGDAVIGQKPLELVARILAALDALLFVKRRCRWR